MKHPDWTKSATIYELNVRQLTPEGTFRAAQEHLPRLKALGIKIIWLMPIYPIGEDERKGTLGSYYSIKNYKAVNPEFGSFDDFKAFVDDAHQKGLKVIVDWVANHTSRDAAWIAEHPDWYKWDNNGKIVAPYDWSDVAQLDTHNRQMWAEMASCMKYWLTEANIDGFRCDMASLLPVEFWEYIRQELDPVRHVFMLAESEDPHLHRSAFDATYCWDIHHIMNGLAQGKNTVEDLDRCFKKQHTLFGPHDMRLVFTSNHDENSWSGTEFERMGLAAKQMAVLSFLVPSIPLIYNGQEVALSHRLKFFDKDCIEWNVNRDFEELYRKLAALKKRYEALWNGELGGAFSYHFDSSSKIFTIEREKYSSTVVGIFNFSSSTACTATPPYPTTDYMKGTDYGASKGISLLPWQYIVLVNSIR
ncbi:alpha-amylase family glycosyl hydrolase [uncultured Acetobacteroides sp.]|uniref:alpha-amylase family glycosyl hydrolase n=1 Tax=uncultured Acetobacteroides sp. TaxID=1760811 RepID=UPI0029F54AE5|nr:alpha-amylase family glycosyl hydrolase [uncultured Acetobacteroides sp.]